MDREDKFSGLETKSAPAIGYSVVCAMGGDRQMTIQCFVGEDEPDEVVNSRMDRIFRVVDRQKAKYDLTKEEKEAEEVALHLRNFLNAIPMAEKALEHQIAVLKVEVQSMQEARKEVYEQGYNAWTASGRKGAFKPGGALDGRLRAMDSEIEKKKAAIDAAPKDADQQRQVTLESVFKYQEDLRKRRLHINELRAMAGMQPYTEYQDLETALRVGAEG